MIFYLKTALHLCKITGTEPSFLLHPLDLLSNEKVPELGFFPGMDIDSKTKATLFVKVLNVLRKHFSIVNMSTHAESVLRRNKIKKLRPHGRDLKPHGVRHEA